jgi:DNA-binding transcriptional ArsR family regulator
MKHDRDEREATGRLRSRASRTGRPSAARNNSLGVKAWLCETGEMTEQIPPTAQPRDRDLAAVAVLIGDPARVAMLTALADGRALPAGELAQLAGIRPATASAHLRKLVEGGLIRVRAQGRHRYHELSEPDLGMVLEALAQIAPPAPVRSLRQSHAAIALAEARTCYDHLAGQRGVQLRDRLLAVGALRMLDDRDHVLTPLGEELTADLGIEVGRLSASRRVLARSCIDWTQRRPHLAGTLPAAITAQFLSRGWLSRGSGRSLRVEPGYDRQVDNWLNAFAVQQCAERR